MNRLVGSMLRSVANVFLASCFVVVTSASCAPSQPTTPQSDPLPASARALKLYPFLAGHENRISNNAFAACKAELTRLGYSLVSTKDKADLTLKLDIDLSEEPSLLNVVVNGKRSVSYKVSVRVIVSSLEGSSLYLGDGEYSSKEDDGVEDGAMSMAQSVVGRLHHSGKLQAYAEQLQQTREAKATEARKKKEQEEADRKAELQRIEDETRQKEDALWNASNPAGCAQPLAFSACEGVKKYIENYPTGRYTTQARQTLQEGEAKIRILVIESDWDSIDRERCKTPKTTRDCIALQGHLDRFPNSAHAQEAREILGKVEKKLQELAKREKQMADAEEARQKREAAAEEARQKREAAAEEARAKAEALKACTEECRNSCMNWRTGGVRGPCLNRCVAIQCQ